MELLFNVTQVSKYNITSSHSSTINIGFVLMTSVIVSME
jgi:hypothetical protein